MIARRCLVNDVRVLLPQSREHFFEVRWIGTGDVDFFEAELRGMELVSRNPGMAEGAAIGSIAQHRMTQMGEGRTDLVQKPRSRSNFDQARSVELFERPHPLHGYANTSFMRILRALDHPHSGRSVLGNHETHFLLEGLAQISGDDGAVDLAYPMLVKSPPQATPGRLRGGDQQDLRGDGGAGRPPFGLAAVRHRDGQRQGGLYDGRGLPQGEGMTSVVHITAPSYRTGEVWA